MTITTTLSAETVATVVEPEVKEKIGKALGRLASGVFVVTLKHDHAAYGVMATWINQASFHPPMLTIAFNKEREFLLSVKNGSALTVNVLGKDNMDIFKQFAKPAREGEDRFAGLALAADRQAGPVFSAAVAYLDCQVESTFQAGDHVIVLCQVTGGNVLNPDSEPMVHLRKNGFQY